MSRVRVGNGFDVHRFGAGDHVILAGVRIEHDHGLIAHSDGDVAVHALCDALLGAAGLGDIGRHFPDTDPAYAGADSRDLLRRVIARLNRARYQVVNVDLTILAQAPRIAPHVGEMCRRLASDLGVPLDAVNVKATTTEQLGLVGRREGIAAMAVALIEHDAGSR